MTINGHEVKRLDTFDAEVVEKIEQARETLTKELERAESVKKQSEAIRIQCSAVAAFLNELWGEGTAERVLEGKVHLLKAIQAFEDAMRVLNEDTQEQNNELNNILKKYSSTRVKATK